VRLWLSLVGCCVGPRFWTGATQSMRFFSGCRGACPANSACLLGSGGTQQLGSLTYHTVWSQSGRSSAREIPIACATVSVLPGARARRAASLACAPVQLYFGLFCLVLYDASCSVGLLHNTYAAALTQPISLSTAAPHAAALPSSQLKGDRKVYYKTTTNGGKR